MSLASSVTARVDDLAHRARSDTGLDDFGGNSWREGLEVLVASAVAEADLTARGESSFYGGIVRTLCNRLRIEDWYGRHPEIDEQVVEVELLGVGFPRTGSSALSSLLAEDPGTRSLRVWEAPAPCPPPGVSEAADQERIAAAAAGMRLRDEALPGFQAMFPMSASGPVEDHELVGLEFRCHSHLVNARVPTYAAWFLDCDMEAAFRYEERVLKLLQWRCPPSRWSLKCPTHSLFLDAFARVFPGSRFVMTHRDVREVLPSVADLYCTLLGLGSDHVDRREVGLLNLEQWAVALERMLAYRVDHEERFFDIGFSSFQSDPIAEIRRLYEWLGRPLTAETEASMRRWRKANPRDKHGRHSYAAEDFGIDDALVRERYAAYWDRFAPLLG